MTKKNKRVLVNVLLILLLIPVVFIGNTLYGDYSNDVQQRKLTARIGQQDISEEGLLDFAPLNGADGVNRDIIAWLRIDDTRIDYPVVQSYDNNYYLRRDLERKYNYNGSLFLDYRSKKNFSGFLSVIYGHNMLSGMMFSDLPNFVDKKYFDDRPTGTIFTPERTYTLRFFAFANTVDGSSYYRLDFANTEDRMAYIEFIKTNADNVRDIEVDFDSKIVMLSTCGRALGKSRSVLFGVLE